MFEVAHGFHVLVCRRLRVEHGRACFAGHLRLPVSRCVHVLFRCARGAKVLAACIAVKSRRPVMVSGIHVIRLALMPVILIFG